MHKGIMATVSVLVIISSGFLVCGADTITAQTDNTIDVFMIAGQSNAAYTVRADPDTAEPVCEYGTAYYFGDSTSPVLYVDWDSTATYGIYDIVNSDGSAHIGGIEQSFSAVYCEKTEHKVCTVNVAVSGSKIADWSLNQTYYVWAQEVFTYAMAALESMGYEVGSVNLIWLQGESNPTWQIQAYKNRFVAMFHSMTHTDSDYSFNDDYDFENCIISLTRQHRGQNSCIAQIELDAENDDIKLGCIVCDHFTYDNGLLYNDDTHYTQLGRNIVGEDLATSFVEKFL